MPDNYSKNIVYLSKEQYQELITNDIITVNGVTVNYNDNDIYVTPQTEPVTDVQVNGTSIVQNGVANVPQISTSAFGVAKVGAYKTINSCNQHLSTFYGLAKVAGHDEKDSTETLGTYTDGAKAAIQNMLGITDLISTEESSTATAAHALNSTFMMDGKLHRATAAIAIGDAVEVGTNCEVVKADEIFVKNTDIASSNHLGIMKPGNGLVIGQDGSIHIFRSYIEHTKAGTEQYRPVVPENQHAATFYGLSKVAGVDLANETVTLGTYPETSKTAIKTMLGVTDPQVTDVQVNGTSVVSNGVANIPLASESNHGVVKIGEASTGIRVDSNGYIKIYIADSANIKTASTATSKPITPGKQHESVFYGLAKASGDTTQASSSNVVGNYTDAAKSAIRNMLGATSSNVIAVQDEQPTDTDTKVWLPETEAQGIQVPTMEDLGNYVQKTDYATTTSYGLLKIGTSSSGLQLDPSGYLKTYCALSADVKAGTDYYKPIVPQYEHAAVFYGLAKAAGDSTQSASSNAVGTYTTDAKAAIQSMLGVPGDVQVNGTSVVNNGVANVPVASTSAFGIAKIDETYGVSIRDDGKLRTVLAQNGDCKGGSNTYKPITPYSQHNAVFYGLSKVAGVDLYNTTVTLGTYPETSKSAIRSLIGVESGISLVETITGTTPTITGQPNVKYVCGEVSTLSITPPVNGTIDVIFTSGSTATVLTLPNTVKLPAWFDATSLETDTIYEIMISDGVYGSVMIWEN